MAFATWGRGESRRSCVKVRAQAFERAQGGQRGLLVRARRSAPPEDEARAHRPILCPAGTPGRAARDQAAPAILDVKVLLTPKKSPCTASVARGPHSRLVCPFFVNKRTVSSLNAPFSLQETSNQTRAMPHYQQATAASRQHQRRPSPEVPPTRKKSASPVTEGRYPFHLFEDFRRFSLTMLL